MPKLPRPKLPKLVLPSPCTFCYIHQRAIRRHHHYQNGKMAAERTQSGYDFSYPSDGAA